MDLWSLIEEIAEFILTPIEGVFGEFSVMTSSKWGWVIAVRISASLWLFLVSLILRIAGHAGLWVHAALAESRVDGSYEAMYERTRRVTWLDKIWKRLMYWSIALGYRGYEFFDAVFRRPSGPSGSFPDQRHALRQGLSHLWQRMLAGGGQLIGAIRDLLSLTLWNVGAWVFAILAVFGRELGPRFADSAAQIDWRWLAGLGLASIGLALLFRLIGILPLLASRARLEVLAKAEEECVVAVRHLIKPLQDLAHAMWETGRATPQTLESCIESELAGTGIELVNWEARPSSNVRHRTSATATSPDTESPMKAARQAAAELESLEETGFADVIPLVAKGPTSLWPRSVLHELKKVGLALEGCSEPRVAEDVRNHLRVPQPEVSSVTTPAASPLRYGVQKEAISLNQVQDGVNVLLRITKESMILLASQQLVIENISYDAAKATQVRARQLAISRFLRERQ